MIKYEKNRIMQILGEQTLESLYLSSEGNYRNDIASVLDANNIVVDGKSYELATDLVMLGMLYGTRLAQLGGIING